MDIESIRQKLYADFDAEGIAKRQEKAMAEQAKAQAEMPVLPEPVDLYQRNQDRIYEVNQKSFPKGSSKVVSIAVSSVVDGAGAEGLARAYKRAKDDSDALKERGERGRAEIRRQQYMQEYFLPAVEIVVNSATPDDLLANKSALSELDKYVLLDGSGDGYTASYVRQAYGNQLGQVEGKSDSVVQSGVQKLNGMLDNGDNRLAFGLAKRLKDQIDSGERSASDTDYALIGRIVAYFSR